MAMQQSTSQSRSQRFGTKAGQSLEASGTSGPLLRSTTTQHLDRRHVHDVSCPRILTHNLGTQKYHGIEKSTGRYHDGPRIGHQRARRQNSPSFVHTHSSSHPRCLVNVLPGTICFLRFSIHTHTQTHRLSLSLSPSLSFLDFGCHRLTRIKQLFRPFTPGLFPTRSLRLPYTRCSRSRRGRAGRRRAPKKEKVNPSICFCEGGRPIRANAMRCLVFCDYVLIWRISWKGAGATNQRRLVVRP